MPRVSREAVGVDDLGIEVAASPHQHVVVLFVVWVPDRFEKLAVAPGPTDVLRRATSGSFNQTWIGDPRNWVGHPLVPNGVFPAIAEIVKVFERSAADVFQRIDQACLARVERAVAELRIRHAPADVAGAD